MRFLLALTGLSSILLGYNLSHAQSLDLSMGQGLHHVPRSGFYSLGIRTPVDQYYSWRLDTGFWSDQDNKSSFFTSVLLGREIGAPQGLNGSLYVGIMFHTQPDNVLSTPFQFTEEINLMYRNIGLGFKHISNAGIKRPNKGRDYLYFRYRLEF